MRRYLLMLTLTAFSLAGWAEDQDEPNAAIHNELKLQYDSLVREMQQLKINEIVMQNALNESGRTAREDSLRKAEQKQRIDSLRRITPGVPLIIGGDTLLHIYASFGGEDAVHRAEAIARKITQVGKSLTLTTDSVYIFESEYSADIMCGGMVLMRVSDLDGLWQGMTRQELAKHNKKILEKEIASLQETYGLKAKLQELAWAALLIVVQIVLFLLTARFINYLRQKIITASGKGRLKPLYIKDYELLNLTQVKHFLLLLTRMLLVMLIIIQLVISLPLLFSIFPETEKFTWRMIDYVWEPLRDLFTALVYYFPNMVKIVLALYIVRWILKGIRHTTDEIGAGRLVIDQFYADWAAPTYQIIRIFVVAFTLVVIWPWLPGSESGIFKGVSIFVAALFSLGSTASIGNLVSGIIITYMRPFLVGDYVKIGDSEGVVVEKNAFVTRLRDIKENIITVPNNSILTQQTVNYSSAARLNGGTIVHSAFTFTYKVPRKTIEAYLLEAAARCRLLLKEPAPFVLVTALEDFYTRYEINGYTMETERLFEVYSELHKHIIDVFSEHELDPTSSHFIKMEKINND